MPRELVLELIQFLPTAADERYHRLAARDGVLPDSEVADRSGKFLSRLGDPACDVLVSLLDQSCATMRERALLGLGQMSHDGRHTSLSILRAVADPVPAVRRAAVRALIAVNRLGSLQPDADPYDGLSIAQAPVDGVFQYGSNWCPNDHIPDFVAVLADLFRWRRAEVAFALADMLWAGGPGTVAAVADSLYDRVNVGLSGTCWDEGVDAVLRRFGTAAVEVSAQRLGHGNLQVRLIAADCLRDASDTARVLPTLLEVLAATRHQEELHLKAWRPLGQPKTPRDHQLWATYQDRRSLILALGRAGVGAMPTLEAGLRKPEMEGCYLDAYLEAVGRMGPAAAPLTPFVGRHLQSDNWKAGPLAVTVLGRIGRSATDYLNDLTNRLNSLPPEPENTWVRSSARTTLLAAIARISPTRAVMLVPDMLGQLNVSASDCDLIDALVGLADAALPAIADAIREDHPALPVITSLLPKFGPSALRLLLEVMRNPLCTDLAVQGIEELGPEARSTAFTLLASEYPASRTQFLKRATEPTREPVYDDLFHKLVRFSARPAVATWDEVKGLLDATLETIGSQTMCDTDRAVLDHLSSLNQIKYLPFFRTFWCIGLVDRQAMRTRERAVGLKQLENRLAKWRSRVEAYDLRISNGYLRECFFELEGLFDTGPLFDVWGPTETTPSFRLEGPTKPSHYWGPRADRVWRWIDLYLARLGMRPAPGGDPGPNKTVDFTPDP